MSDYQSLLRCLRSLFGVVEIDPRSQLHHDTLAVCNYLEQPVYRLAVFAPFNHGKSTLLNALLGSKALPIDLIPSTGAGIVVQYGSELATEIVLRTGETVRELGTALLDRYAVLDENRRMRSDVAEVKISCDHPWLKTGIELLDLPGTNDREAQNNLVRDKLLSADLVIHVLDARKLMTLEERQHLTQWLQNRGITRVVFVVNFLNLLATEEQQEVKQRIYAIAESFRSDLPGGISNIFCVDALPALRARLKGNLPAAQTTGLTTLESALQTIASQEDRDRKLPRAIEIGELLLEQARDKQQQLEKLQHSQQQSSQEQIEVRQKAEKLIQQGFERSISDLRGWLYLPKLLTNYQPSLAIALQQTTFSQWLGEFAAEVQTQQQTVNKYILQGCEFLTHANPQLLAIDLPPAPVIQLVESVPTDRSVNTSNADSSKINSELNSILQGKIGSVILGGASYVLNKVAPKPDSANHDPKTPQRNNISSQIYADAAADYLKEFSDRANAELDRYEQIAKQYLTYIPQTKSDRTETNFQLQLIEGLIHNLQTELSNLTNNVDP